MLIRRCPVCAERTANILVSLISPRCKVCRAKFRIRLPFGVGFIGGFVSQAVFLGSLVAAVLMGSAWPFTLGLVAFTVLEVVFFRVGRLEPDTRDPITAMQARRYARQVPDRTVRR